MYLQTKKTALILRVAWPSAMHAVSAVVVGKKQFESLRTSLMQSLGLQKPGANPELQCCVASLLFDPQVLAVTDTVRDARSLGCHSEVVLDFQEGLGPEAPDYDSLSEILCQRLGQAGFHAGPTALARDLGGDFPFLTCAFGEFLARLQWSWTSAVAARCSTACPSVDLNLLMWCIPGKPKWLRPRDFAEVLAWAQHYQ